jgi:hypothetical protein
MLILDVERSEVVIEVTAAGLLAAAAHDLQIVAKAASGASDDGVVMSVRFPVSGLSVWKSRRHGRGDWHEPSRSDAKDIEGRIRTQVFPKGDEIVVVGSEDTIVVRAPGGEQRVVTNVTMERSDEETRVRGSCELSLRALGTGKVQIPLGAVKLEDIIRVRFNVVARVERKTPPRLEQE